MLRRQLKLQIDWPQISIVKRKKAGASMRIRVFPATIRCNMFKTHLTCVEIARARRNTQKMVLAGKKCSFNFDF